MVAEASVTVVEVVGMAYNFIKRVAGELDEEQKMMVFCAAAEEQLSHV